MDAATISAIAEVIDAIPDGPYIVVESPFPALEQIGGGDINLGSTFGDVNFPFGEDFLDVHDETTTDESTNISVLDVGPDVVVDSAIEPTPEPETGELVADSAIEQPEVIIDETVADSAIESAVAGEPGENVVDSAIVPADTGEIAMDSAVEPGEEADPDGFGEPAKPIFGSL
ncbi:hypothetical protein [Corynebacterium xerosis]|uniref:Uncharacterized protein n=1 Tax=Corynebacterium xerosis TaxID=1725 RepID=A0A7X9SVU1_9CORY|nr:hypothetical protein [Corynebacterium xerosis]NMF08979.1 hypothetical protein [Corynebacterium xerosis]SQB95399.1 Uncharacterised protein [Clostridium paraputrificum]